MALPLKMSWQPSLLSQKRQNGAPLGLRNLGNSCYLNSVLQCLTYTPPLANFCLNQLHSSLCDSCVDGERKRDCPFCILEKRIARSLRADHAQDSPAKIQRCLRLYAEHFRSGRQEDAHEFLRYVIDACHNTSLRLRKLRQSRAAVVEATASNTIVKEIFGGSLQSQVKCVLCGAESNKVDEIMDISLDILHSASLKDALHKFFEPEVLDGNNKYKCEKCKILVPARKQMSLFQAPNILVIQLKRFEGIYGGKIDKAISFEELLVLSNFLCRGSQDSSPDYYLFGAIVHAGFSPDSGHYYAYVKDAMGRWYCCNDSYVSVTTLEEVLSEKVYILFYARTKQRPASSTSVLVANGVKSHACNGVGASKKQPSDPPPRPAHGSRTLEDSACKDPPALPMADKLTSSPRVKFSISGNIASKRVPAVTNGKMLLHENHLVEKSNDCKQTVQLKMNGKDLSSKVNTNGFLKENKVPLHVRPRKEDVEHERYNLNKNSAGALDGMKIKSTASLNGNGKAGSVILKSTQSDLQEGNGIVEKCLSNGSVHDSHESCNVGTNHELAMASTSGKMVDHSCILLAQDAESRVKVEKCLSNGSVHDSHESCNVGTNHELAMASTSGKMVDHSCILLAQDAESRVKVEKLKEVLKNESSTMLRSCGWSNEVYDFMRAKKRKCTENVENASLDSNHLRKLLIAEARTTFISSIPESLKEDLINRLRSFSKEMG